MQQPNKPIAYIMLGFPGSGKSFVSDWLTRQYAAVHLRADDMRLAIFGEDRLEYHRSAKYQKQVHGAMHYAAAQVLIAGSSVIYDSNHNSIKSRKPMRQLAVRHGALPIIVWVRTPLELARERVLEREAQGGHKVFEIDFVDRMAKNLEDPSGEECAIIEIDGTATIQSQQASFREQLTKITTDQVQ